ncbi:hypothetical protein QA612_12965 [Evansella sp. AB-P1]|uniref:hypothetical protein n=1 Tax=Evansella sp. AB-P1 TaxID=3037653 RepID=UPI00241EC050|nr:hypothetical protein [Evansella sp. AB-P1]MDG5788393.1 hypothetical protein [Evansella sp. AB-P1]
MKENSDWSEEELDLLEEEMRDALSLYQVKEATSKETKDLISFLQLEESELENESVVPIEPFTNPMSSISLWKQFVIQFTSTKWPIWLSSFVFIGMLTLLVRPVSRITYHYDQPFIVLFPLLIFVGILYTYKTWNREMRLVEMVTPFPPVLLLFCRMFSILMINIVLALGASLYLFFTIQEFMLFSFILSWLAPTIFLIGLLAYLVFWKGFLFGLIISSGIWFAMIVQTQMFIRSVLFIDLYYIIHFSFLLIGILFLFISYKKGYSDKKILTY